jgi:hypothetical protein
VIQGGHYNQLPRLQNPPIISSKSIGNTKRKNPEDYKNLGMKKSLFEKAQMILKAIDT